MNDFTFLTDEQIFGKNQLGILKTYGTRCAITDFSILLGADVLKYYSGNHSSQLERTGLWWTASLTNQYNVSVVDKRGDNDWYYPFYRDCGARPVLSYASILKAASNGKRGENGILEVEYGEYPQNVVSEEFSRILEMAFANMPYSNNEMKLTGKSYTTDSVDNSDMSTPFHARTHTEYEYNGKKYIRFVGDSNCSESVLNDGRKILNGGVYWVGVEPIKWMIDVKTNIALSKKILFSGVLFNSKTQYDGDFNRTDIKKFMRKYFYKDIIPSTSKGIILEEEERIEMIKAEEEKRSNPYGFNFEDVSEEDIIKGAIESNIAVFLHGQSSEGKSARVKQIDPDCVIIYLRNSTPESLNGKSVYNSETGEMIDIKPTWLKKLEDKCEREPDKYHIVFLDEITNALVFKV